MIKFIKRDFIRIRAYLSYVFNREIPVGIAILYYVVVGLVVLPFMPFIWMYYKIQMKRLERWFKEERA